MIVTISVHMQSRNELVDEYVRVAVENALHLAHLRVVEDVVFAPAQADAPVVAGVHRALVHDRCDQPVLLPPEDLHLLVLDGIAVLDFLVLEGLEPVQVDHQYLREALDVQLLQRQRH